MKKSFIYGAMALIGAGLMQSCSDEPAVSFDNDEGVFGTATGSITALGPDSRTTITENTEGYKLEHAWTAGDKVVVFDSEDSKNLGVLSFDEGSNFSGTLRYGSKTGNRTVTVAYLGTNGNATRSVTPNDYAIDLTSQTGIVDDLVKNDIELAKNSTLAIGEKSWSINFTVKSILSFVHFGFDLPKGVTYNNEPITVSGLNSKTTVNLISGAFGKKEASDITVTNASVDDNGRVHIYLAVIPGDNQTPTISVTIGGVNYTGTRESAINFEGNTYYRAENGQGGDVPLVSQTATVTYYLNDNTDNNNKSWKYVFTELPKEITVGDFEGKSNGEDNLDKVLGKAWTLKGWSYKSNGSNVTVKASETATLNLNVGDNYTIYVDARKKINYDPNEGKFDDGTTIAYSTMPAYGTKIAIGIEKTLTRAGYTFLGWSKEKNATAATFSKDRTEYSVADYFNEDTAEHTLYAVWQKDESALNVDAGSLDAVNPWK